MKYEATELCLITFKSAMMCLLIKIENPLFTYIHIHTIYIYTLYIFIFYILAPDLFLYFKKNCVNHCNLIYFPRFFINWFPISLSNTTLTYSVFWALNFRARLIAESTKKVWDRISYQKSHYLFFPSRLFPDNHLSFQLQI